MKHLIIYAIIGTFISSSLNAAPSEDVWVAVRIIDKGVGQGTSEYYGTIDKTLFATLTKTVNLIGFIEMNNVGTLYNDKYITLKEEVLNGKEYGYSNKMYFRAETLVRIIPLDPEFVEKTILHPHQSEHGTVANPSITNSDLQLKPTSTPIQSILNTTSAPKAN